MIIVIIRMRMSILHNVAIYFTFLDFCADFVSFGDSVRGIMPVICSSIKCLGLTGF